MRLIQVPAIDWWVSERAAWAPPEDLTVSQWAERYRVLPKQSSMPGPWNNHMAPYAVGVMDAFNDPMVERITIMASVQSSKTEAVYNMLGYAISQDPAPALIVMPTLATLKRVNKRLQDMLFASPELSKHMTDDDDDLTQKLLSLDRMDIYFATAGSSADLQNVEARFIICDETDEYPFGDEDGSPIEKAIDRSTTYWNRKIIILSRPTTQEGYINSEYNRSDRRKYWVPCPFCGGYQILNFHQIKHKGEQLGAWPRDRRESEYIKQERVARYECQYCQAEIDDKDKPAMLNQGKWCPEDHYIDRDGTMPPMPSTTHVGFGWNVLYSRWRTFSEIMAKFFSTKDDRDKHRIFINQWLAEPWKEVVKEREASEILKLKTERQPLVVPEGTIALTAGIDSQKYGFWIVIRAWLLDPDPTSHLIRYGFLDSFEDLERWLFQDVYRCEKTGLEYPVWRAGIDIGGGESESGDSTMTEKIYDWLRRSGQGRVFGVKGASRVLAGGKKMVMKVIDKMPGKGAPIPGGIRIWHLDTGLLKDAIWSRIETEKFHIHVETDEAYARQISAEAKERDNRGRYVWVQQGRRANHLFDCEVYAAAMADPECMGGIMVLPRPTPKAVEEKQAGVNQFTGKPAGTWLRR